MATIENFYGYLRSREEIRLKRATGVAGPWTDDPILQKYKFTNVRREHDYTSIKLREIYAKHEDASREVILLNCAIARYFGTCEFYEAVGWQDDFHPNHLKDLANARLRDRQRVFTGAYVITNQGISAPKQEVVTDIFIRGIWEKAPLLATMVSENASWKHVVEELQHVQGFGGTGFMAKEVTLDTMYFEQFWPMRTYGQENILSAPPDYWQWTPIGPGARRGLQRLGEKPDLRSLLIITDMQGTTSVDYGPWWPPEWGRLSPTDVQFGLCEFFKMTKVLLGEGKPRSLFKPRG